MRKLSLMCTLVLSTFTVLNSCKKGDSTGYSSLRQLRAAMAPQPASIEIDAATGGTFNLGRVRVVVPPDAFIATGGGAISGKVTLQVTDVLNKGEMLFGPMPITSTDALVSGGEVEVEAIQNNVWLRLKPGKSIQVKVPQLGRDATGMTLFGPQWQEDTTNVFTGVAGNNFVWLERKQSGAMVIGADTVTFFADTLGWTNIDRYLSNPNYQYFSVMLSGTTPTNNSEIFVAALYDQYNGAWQIRNGTGNVYHEGHLPNIPVHFVAYTVVNGKLYGGVTPATPVNGGNYQINLTEVNPTDFKAQLAKL